MIKQIAVFLENESGKASACCKVLKDANINLLALSIADTKEFGILRILAREDEKALKALKDAGFLASMVELVGVEVPNRSGALSEILILLGDGGVNVEYMYSYAEADGRASIALKASTPKRATEILKAAGVKVI